MVINPMILHGKQVVIVEDLLSKMLVEQFEKTQQRMEYYVESNMSKRDSQIRDEVFLKIQPYNKTLITQERISNTLDPTLSFKELDL